MSGRMPTSALPRLGPLLAIVLSFTAVAGCAAPLPSVTPQASVSLEPSAVPTSNPSPAVSCGNLEGADCSLATAAVLVVAEDLGTAISIDIDRGFFCSEPPLSGGCPMPPAPDGGRWVASAIVTFSDLGSQAYVNISESAGLFSGRFVMVATPQPSPSAS